MDKPAEAIIAQYFHGDGATLIDRYFADGMLAFQELNTDGSVVQASYDTGGHLTQFAINYSNGTFDQLTFDTSGNETGETIRHADGSRDIYAYDIAGQPYTSEHVVTDASGHSTLVDQYGADGSLQLQQTVDTKASRPSTSMTTSAISPSKR